MQEAPALTFLAPQRPPRTPRELLHLVLGNDHALHSVKLWDKDNLGFTVWCSCGKKGFRLDSDLAHRSRFTMKEAEYALTSAPKRELWGLV